MIAPGLIVDESGKLRCAWRDAAPEYRDYHDLEWGRPVLDDLRLFEKICLEGFQAGLAWITILRKREAFRQAFDGFDFQRIADYSEVDLERLMVNAGIVRNRRKILSVVNNARRCMELVERHGSLATFMWSFAPSAEERPAVVDFDFWRTSPTSAAAARLSKRLKENGWSFVGPTTMHALMQATGMVNDHLEGCVCREEIETARRASYQQNNSLFQ